MENFARRYEMSLINSVGSSFILYNTVIVLYLAATVIYFLFLISHRKEVGAIASTVTFSGWVVNTAALVGRGVADHHAPWSNLYETLFLFSWASVLGYMVMEFKYKVRVAGAFVLTIVMFAVGAARMLPYRYQLIAVGKHPSRAHGKHDDREHKSSGNPHLVLELHHHISEDRRPGKEKEGLIEIGPGRMMVSHPSPHESGGIDDPPGEGHGGGDGPHLFAMGNQEEKINDCRRKIKDDNRIIEDKGRTDRVNEGHLVSPCEVFHIPLLHP